MAAMVEFALTMLTRGAPSAWGGLFSTALLLAVLSACTPALTTGVLVPAEGVVYGTIRDTTGALQANARFEVIVFANTCDRPNPVLQGVPTVTPDGNYRQLLRGPHFSKLVACLVVNASVQTSTAVLLGSVRDSTIVLRSAGSAPPDSLRIDVVVK